MKEELFFSCILILKKVDNQLKFHVRVDGQLLKQALPTSMPNSWSLLPTSLRPTSIIGTCCMPRSLPRTSTVAQPHSPVLVWKCEKNTYQHQTNVRSMHNNHLKYLIKLQMQTFSLLGIGLESVLNEMPKTCGRTITKLGVNPANSHVLCWTLITREVPIPLRILSLEREIITLKHRLSRNGTWTQDKQTSLHTKTSHCQILAFIRASKISTIKHYTQRSKVQSTTGFRINQQTNHVHNLGGQKFKTKTATDAKIYVQKIITECFCQQQGLVYIPNLEKDHTPLSGHIKRDKSTVKDLSLHHEAYLGVWCQPHVFRPISSQSMMWSMSPQL